MSGDGTRHNEGKIRHDLLEPFAMNELAKIFTKGAEKYAPFNWLKGMKWSKMRASLGRHLSAYDMGQDFDIDENCPNCLKGNCTNHTGLYHIAQVAWNALGILSYYKHYPQGDDRVTEMFNIKRIGIDVDEVLADFIGAYIERYKQDVPIFWNFDKNFEENYATLINDEEFWVNLKPILKPTDLPFEPVVYITSRPETLCEFTKKWLFEVNKYPIAPVICCANKLDICKEYKLDVFIDDKFDTFCQLNKNGILCYLFDAPHNRSRSVGYRRINVNNIKSVL